MSAKQLAITVALTLAACQSSSTEDPGVLVTLGAATMRVPTDWSPSLNDPSGIRQSWSPSANDDKESLTLRVVKRPAGLVADDLLDQALDAQGVLTEGEVLKQERITTVGQLPGLWMEVSFLPPNASTRYVRTHVTVIGADHVFHLMYTALKPDPAQRAIHLAVNSISEEG